uniref:Ig-like domain-containing protein n=1 Tax=Sinocyclocheilus grahami TaxID=75366 RepID=A0A672PZZ2_SINGR
MESIIMIIALFLTAQDFLKNDHQLHILQFNPVTLRCNYSTTTTNAYLFWYKQLSNRSPTFILNKYSFSEGITEADINKRFSATLDSTSRRVPLTIQDVRVSDSAVYYCALQPTSTTSHTSTELTITGVTLSDSALYYCALRVGAQWYKVNMKLYKNSNQCFSFNVKPHHTHNLEFSEYNYTCGNTCNLKLQREIETIQ